MTLSGYAAGPCSLSHFTSLFFTLPRASCVPSRGTAPAAAITKPTVGIGSLIISHSYRDIRHTSPEMARRLQAEIVTLDATINTTEDRCPKVCGWLTVTHADHVVTEHGRLHGLYGEFLSSVANAADGQHPCVDYPFR